MLGTHGTADRRALRLPPLAITEISRTRQRPAAIGAGCLECLPANLDRPASSADLRPHYFPR